MKKISEFIYQVKHYLCRKVHFWLRYEGIDVLRQTSTYPRIRAATRDCSSHVVSWIYLVHLATSDSLGLCTWLLDNRTAPPSIYPRSLYRTLLALKTSLKTQD
jgi:hypothetical protein